MKCCEQVDYFGLPVSSPVCKELGRHHTVLVNKKLSKGKNEHLFLDSSEK